MASAVHCAHRIERRLHLTHERDLLSVTHVFVARRKVLDLRQTTVVSENSGSLCSKAARCFKRKRHSSRGTQAHLRFEKEDQKQLAQRAVLVPAGSGMRRQIKRA
eukprot:6189013-Pleurochrysis_carterae.AAC.1